VHIEHSSNRLILVRPDALNSAWTDPTVDLLYKFDV
jgi:hypothetical protein